MSFLYFIYSYFVASVVIAVVVVSLLVCVVFLHLLVRFGFWFVMKEVGGIGHVAWW